MDADNNINTTKTQQPVPPRFTTGWLGDLDGRLSLAKELRQRFESMTNDLGGSDSLSYVQRSLCERALWLEFWLSQQERDLANGTDFNVSGWIQATNSLQGIFSKLGLRRRAKDVPTLDGWIASRARR
jgi:hypothetical protein